MSTLPPLTSDLIAAPIVHVDEDVAWREILSQAARASLPRAQIFSAPTVALGLERCATLRPAVVVTELWLSDGDGFSLINALVTRFRGVRLLALTHRCDEVAMHRAQTGHLSGLIWKTPAAPTQLRAALCAASAGGIYFPPEVRAEMRRLRNLGDACFKILSTAEQKLMPLFGEGMSDEAISGVTGQEAGTVKWHRHAIRGKLSLKRESDLMCWAWQKGFVMPRLPTAPCLFVEQCCQTENPLPPEGI